MIRERSTRSSLATAAQIKKLAEDLRLPRLFLVGSKVQSDDDRDFIAAGSPGLAVLGSLPADPAVREADRTSAAVYDVSRRLRSEAQALVQALMRVRTEV